MGIIVVPLFLIGLWGWYYVVELSWFFLRERRFLKWAKANQVEVGKGQTVGRHYPGKSLLKTYLSLIDHYLDKSEADIQEQVEIKLGFILNAVKQKLLSIQIFAATAPLLGLLGTVNGMIVTFKVLGYYGNSSPILLSDGISEALLTTQSGLVIAFPLLFFQVILRNRSKNLQNYLQLAYAKKKHGKS